MKQKYRCVGDVRYKGLFSVLELVKDKGTREPLAPFNGNSPEMNKLAEHLKSKHLYAFSRFNMLWVCPPLIIKEEELRHGLEIVEKDWPWWMTRCFRHPLHNLRRFWRESRLVDAIGR